MKLERAWEEVEGEGDDGGRREDYDLRRIVEKEVEQWERWKPRMWKKQEAWSASYSELGLNHIRPAGN